MLAMIMILLEISHAHFPCLNFVYTRALSPEMITAIVPRSRSSVNPAAAASGASRCRETVVEIRDQVVHMLRTDGETDRVAADALIRKLRVGELRVRR